MSFLWPQFANALYAGKEFPPDASGANCPVVEFADHGDAITGARHAKRRLPCKWAFMDDGQRRIAAVTARTFHPKTVIL